MATSRKPRGKAAELPDPFAAPPPQQELAPAAVAPQENDAARAAIATINTQLSEFDKVEAGLQTLETRYTKVAYPVDTKAGMDEAVLARREIKAVRVAVEHARKAAKAPVLDLGRNIDSRAGAITARLVAIEDPIDDQIRAQEKKEADRIADLERRVREIRETPAQCIGKTAAQLQEVLDGLNTLPLETFQEYRESAAKAQFDATQAVQHLLTQARQAEELAELQRQQRAEAERKQRIQDRIDTITDLLNTAAMCRTSTRLQDLITRLEPVVIDAGYQEFAPAAREEKARVLAELVRLRDEKKAAEDVRAAAAAAPAPTPAPTPAPAPTEAPAPVRSNHDQINDDAAQRLQRQFGSLGGSLASDFRRVMAEPAVDMKAGSENTGHAAQVAGYEFMTGQPTRIVPPDFDAVDADVPQRPTDAEVLAVVADHYEVDAATAAAWLRTFDAAAALAQQSLIPTT